MESMFQSPASDLSLHEQGILSAILYFDIFGHPLLPEEIARFCPVGGLTADEARSLCCGEALRRWVREEDGCFLLRSATGDPVRRRKEMESKARRLWKIAQLVGRLVAAFPFVRSVFVSGELSKGVAGPGSDIDLVIVTSERRLWIVRTMLVLFKRIFLFGRRRFFCINHLQTVDHLGTSSQSYYDAVEIVTLRQVGGEPVLDRFLEANPWIAQVLPNAMPKEPRRAAWFVARRSMWNGLAGSIVFDRLDARLMSFWERIWSRRYAKLPPAERRRRFACTPYLSTAYGTDNMEPILSTWQARLLAHGLKTPTTAET